MSTELTKRKHVRFKPDIEDLCLIDLNLTGEFKPTIGAFIVNESPMSGCGLVLRVNDGVDSGTKIRLKLGKLAPLTGEVVWHRELDHELVKVGIKLLD
ncbi:MAG: hypothetical protein R3B45_08275 [Bdellovibrionota bacterium]